MTCNEVLTNSADPLFERCYLSRRSHSTSSTTVAASDRPAKVTKPFTSRYRGNVAEAIFQCPWTVQNLNKGCDAKSPSKTCTGICKILASLIRSSRLRSKRQVDCQAPHRPRGLLVETAVGPQAFKPRLFLYPRQEFV